MTIGIETQLSHVNAECVTRFVKNQRCSLAEFTDVTANAGVLRPLTGK
jgi:hypothetical protein